MFKTTITLFAIFAAVAIAADHDIVPAPAAAVPAAGMPNAPAGLPAGVIIPNAQAPPAVPGAGGAPPASNPAANAPKPATNGAAGERSLLLLTAQLALTRVSSLVPLLRHLLALLHLLLPRATVLSRRATLRLLRVPCRLARHRLLLLSWLSLPLLLST
ncbi:hypothetical protein BX661DRAFT_188321, partial [Kickxella alabastrina]|uniref:uncharacterized protein n=1 Tax=Kickxella alabastrina TaxID=61397 RepID=UPI00221F34A2